MFPSIIHIDLSLTLFDQPLGSSQPNLTLHLLDQVQTFRADLQAQNATQYAFPRQLHACTSANPRSSGRSS